MEKSPLEDQQKKVPEKEYTIEALVKAQEELKLWEEKRANVRANNPNKFRSQIKDAGRKVREIREALEVLGIVGKTDAEKVTEILDKLYPDAQSRKTVTYEGQRYQIRYFPLDKSLSGKTVHEWGHAWRPLEEKSKSGGQKV